MFIVGNQQEWEAFGNRHQHFFEQYVDLQNLQNLVFNRTFTTSTPRDRLVFCIGRIVVTDFQEILIMAGNSSGIGALKILRGMYERVVIASYLSTAEESEVENFLDYYWVQQHKYAQEIIRIEGEQVFKEMGHGENWQELQEQYNKVKQKYQVTECKKCGTKRLNHSWSKRSLFEMADKAGEGIRKLAYQAYYQPLQHAHSTVASIHTRFENKVDGVITFKDSPYRKESDEALQYAHLLLLDVLRLQIEYFHLEDLKKPLDRNLSNYGKIWPNNVSQPPNET